MATVYRAQDLKHRRTVAVKVLLPELAAILGTDRFEREIELAARLNHPNILPLHDSGHAGEFLYYVMPYVEGETVRSRLNREKQLPLSPVLRIGREVADALAFAHRAGVVHRDIKPENILLQAEHAVIADFGIAQVMAVAGTGRLTQTGFSLGTPDYMSPEQIRSERELDGRSDVYSLGCVLYEMLAGAPPFTGPSAQAVMARHTLDPVPPLRTIRPTVPASVERAIMKSLAKLPADRFATAAQYAEALGDNALVQPAPRRAVPWWILASAGVGMLGVVLVSRSWSPSPANPVRCSDGSFPPCARASNPPVAAAQPQVDRERARTFLVLPFRNLSGLAEQQWLIEASPTMLADALGQWREVTVVPDERLYPALRRHGLSPGAVMDLTRVRQVAAETGGWTAVAGEIMTVGGRLRVSVRAFDVVTEELMSRVSVDVGKAQDIRSAYESIATTLLHGAGLDQASADLVHATTHSLDAYLAYLRATAHINRGEYRQARAALEEAVRRDSTFAQAYAKLAEVSLLAFSVLEPDNPAYGYAARAAALSSRLPPRVATHVRALRSLLNADFTAARRDLERLITQDSNDVDALETFASLEFLDPLLVGGPGRPRRRGSLNASARLAQRVLALDPTRHGAYQGLVTIYLLAGGQPPGAVAGYRREMPRPVRSSVRAWCSCDFELALGRQPSAAPGDSSAVTEVQLAGPDVMLVPILRDSIVLIPIDSLSIIPPESLAASRVRARDQAQTWVRRWLAAGSGEAEAHRASARVQELEGAYQAALRDLDRADSIGVEAEGEAIAARRMILLGKLGRLDDARRIADSLWQAHYFAGELFESVPAMTEAYAWATNLFAAARDFARARAALAAFSSRLAFHLDLDHAYAATVAVLSGSGTGYDSPVVLPGAVRLAVRDALRAEHARNPDPLLGAWLRTLEATTPNR